MSAAWENTPLSGYNDVIRRYFKLLPNFKDTAYKYDALEYCTVEYNTVQIYSSLSFITSLCYITNCQILMQNSCLLRTMEFVFAAFSPDRSM